MLKIVISPYLSEKSSHFDEILYTAADFELDERDVIKNEKFALDRLRVRQNLFLVVIIIIILLSNAKGSFWCAKYRLKVAQRVKEPKSRSTLCSPIQHSLVR